MELVSCPPADAIDDQGDEHDDLVDAHDDTCRQRGEPQFGRVFLHFRHLVHARLLHGGLYQIGVGCSCVGYIRLCLQAVVHRVAHMDELLYLLELVRYLGGFRFVEVMRVRADTVRYVGQEVQEAPAASAACHAGICRRIPPAEDDGDGQRAEQFHHV